MNNWGGNNHKKWKAKTALRLVHSQEFVNPYPCPVGLVPPKAEGEPRLMIGKRVELTPSEYIRQHIARTLGDDPEAA